MERIAILDNEIEAQLLDLVLTERGIPHRLRSYRDRVYDGVFQAHKGWGQVEADPRNREIILELLAEIRPGGNRKEAD